ncbi:MAG: tRNA preQ1(34) S-adenosylmethionine ribosyltransferase-isomerase QueA [Thermoleophilia bacterium]
MSAREFALEDLDYDLPSELIAQQPVEPRDASRLLVFHRTTGEIEDRVFNELPGLLRRGDVLVRNDTRVFPARAFFRRPTGGRIEVLFLRPRDPAAAGERWDVLVRGRVRPGEVLANERAEWPLRCDESLGEGRWRVTNLAPTPVLTLLETAGVTPLPPYIRQPLGDAERYQTAYAKTVGSAAAPTAGLHFTSQLDAALVAGGVSIETITLHVGLGTFKPLQAETLAARALHGESYEVAAGVLARVREARSEGRRVVAVGTTSVRTLEHLAASVEVSPPGGVYRGETELFIGPGHQPRLVDGIITNFHLPRTSLLALVMAFCGVEETQRLYRHAVDARYRFYSLGDAMVVL